MSNPPVYKQRLDSLPEPQRYIAHKEFFAILEAYGLNEHILPQGIQDFTTTDRETLLMSSELENKTNLPKDFGGIAMLDKIAEVAVWAATGIIERMTVDTDDTIPE
jgi:hypothetical protein